MGNATVTLQPFMAKWKMLHLLGAAFFLFYFETLLINYIIIQIIVLYLYQRNKIDN